MIAFNTLFSSRNRGLLLDITVFVFQLLLIRILTNLSLEFVHRADGSPLAKAAISFFLLALFLLQPLGPILKRWSFHQHFPAFEKEQSSIASLLLSFYRFFYLIAMWILIYIAFRYFVEAFPDSNSERLEKVVVALALGLPVVSGIAIFRYFRKPKKEPRLKFLMTPQAEVLGDVCMFLNVICFQMLFSVYVSSAPFSNALHKITRLASPGSIDGLSGRLYLAVIAALLIYFPPRIFYLVIDQHRKITWLMMLLANLPFILSLVLYVPQQRAKTLHQPAFTVSAVELHAEYEANYQAAMRKYRGQYINVSGRVQTRFSPRSIELDEEIGLDGKNGYPWVYCLFDEDQVETVQALDSNEEVTFQCVGADDWTRGPAMNHCMIVNAP